jgi:ABC-type transport system involved in multi-copper enzyme maturation permease subunit
MNARIAMQMIGADILKVRKKRSTMAWAFLLALFSQVVYFGIHELTKSSGPGSESVGGVHGFSHGLDLLCFFAAPLAAVLIGTEAGAGDSTAGVFRDLVVTGRSRLALFATRAPAALALVLPLITLGFGLLCLGTFALAEGAPTPGASTLMWGWLFALLANGVLCVVAVGLSTLFDSKPATITALIGWQLVLSPIVVGVTSLGSVREALLDAPLLHIDPVGGHDVHIAMSLAAIVATLALWPLIATALGAWRARTMDA